MARIRHKKAGFDVSTDDDESLLWLVGGIALAVWMFRDKLPTLGELPAMTPTHERRERVIEGEVIDVKGNEE